MVGFPKSDYIFAFTLLLNGCIQATETDGFSYKGRDGERTHACIEMLKEELTYIGYR